MEEQRRFAGADGNNFQPGPLAGLGTLAQVESELMMSR